VANVTPVFRVDSVILQYITDTGSSERSVTAIFNSILQLLGGCSTVRNAEVTSDVKKRSTIIMGVFTVSGGRQHVFITAATFRISF
jgi:hypothetical protein